MVADIVFAILFLISFTLVLALSIYNFCKFPNMVNLPNVLVVIMILMTLLSKLCTPFLTTPFVDRVLCLLYSLLFDENADIQTNTLQMFLYFELPFWYLNAA